MPFFRNHQSVGTIDHEFYRFPLVAEVARIAIKARYQLLEYFYTALYQQPVDGTPTLNLMFFLYSEDSNMLPIQAQFFFGSSLLVSLVTLENTTEATIYQPDDQFTISGPLNLFEALETGRHLPMQILLKSRFISEAAQLSPFASTAPTP